MEKRINTTKSLLSLILAFLMLFTALIIPLGVFTAKASNVGDDVVKEGDYYKFSADTATRFWIDIPLNDIKGYLSEKTKSFVTKNNGFQDKRQDYIVPIWIRLDSVKYNGYPIMLQGNVTVNLPGSSLSQLFDQANVTFKSDVKIWLFISAYNYLVAELKEKTTCTLTVYMNGTGVRVDSDKNIFRPDYNVPFELSNLKSKLDHEAYDPNEDLPDYEDFNPQLVTDQNFENEKNGNVPQSGWSNFLNSLARLFGTSANVVQWVLIGVGGIIILSIIIPKRH